MESRGDIVAFVGQVVDSFRDITEEKGLSLLLSSGHSSLAALFDADKWEKILKNLLSNAIKFTPADGQIAVRCQVEENRVVLTIRDNGIGIPSEHLLHIFDRFYQVDTSLTRAYEGSGIGLALAHELTRLVGGTIAVASTPGLATTFTLALPFHPISEEEPVEMLPSKVATDAGPWLFTRARPEAAEHNATRPLILLVEDNTELLTFLAESLSGHYRVLTASTGREGLDIALDELPEIVVSDVMMPEMDGYQLTRRLKTNPVTDHIAVVLLTARSAAANRHQGLAEGADDYLTKPFDLDELRLRLRNLISRQQKLRDFYEKKIGLSPTVPQGPEPLRMAVQEAFVARLNLLIEANLDDSSFRAESLADEVAMSIRTLNRKLTMLAGVSPARLIRTYRLRRAIDLLRAGHPVSETSYMVGFDHPTNFSTAFKELYKKSPSEYLESY
ncbi:ATP-binding protein [Dyadobacter pollutisoli]|uniref:histidine kinase n=1 Tax=Dyadobacter pollutisoli TaxID=2910158 RepID=A0A9E8SN27_9BACT|nr:ATP-binding protein [Dyadobacter pollutisoli]WAC15405.1 ATP-binding protein [Dyadobacter pollutisoli]